LQEKVIGYGKSHSAKEAEEIFGTGIRTVFEWRRLLGKNGNLEQKPPNRKPKKPGMGGVRGYGKECPNTYPREMEGLFKVSELHWQHA
jgi:hypothetical protein